MGKNNTTKANKTNITKKINEFLAEHNLILDNTAKERLSNFKFNQYTEIININDYIKIYNRSKNWNESLIINEQGTSTFVMGSKFL